MDADSLVRITEFIHALKIFILASKRLKDEDIRYLKQIAKVMEEEMENPKVNKVQFEKAEPIMQQIRDLKNLKESLNMPAECYSIVFRLTTGRETVANNAYLGSLSMTRLINEFKRIIDEKIGKLEKEMEEI